MRRIVFIIGCALATIVTGCAGIYSGGSSDPVPQEGLRNLSGFQR